ncbi:MAG: 50S ribosomal protein L12 [Haloarcula sp.]
MEYVYAALILHETGAEINESNLTAVLEAAGETVTASRVKAIVAALEDVDLTATKAQTGSSDVTDRQLPEEGGDDATDLESSSVEQDAPNAELFDALSDESENSSADEDAAAETAGDARDDTDEAGGSGDDTAVDEQDADPTDDTET